MLKIEWYCNWPTNTGKKKVGGTRGNTFRKERRWIIEMDKEKKNKKEKKEIFTGRKWSQKEIQM